MRFWIGIIITGILFCTNRSLAQRNRLDSLAEARINAPTAKDTAFGLKAKKIVPKKIYDFLFRDIYNSTNQGTQVSAISENPFKDRKSVV